MNERRKSNRTPVRLQVELSCELLGTVLVHTLELSDNGAFLVSPELYKLKPNDEIRLQVVGLPETMPVIHAEVIRVEKEGIGVQFVL
jgi:Asp-tRNA(Asn)/Glu-tRNA(Gln) amidotransferase B subunit